VVRVSVSCVRLPPVFLNRYPHQQSPPRTWSPKWQGAKEGKPGYTLHEGYASSSHRRAWPCTQHDLGGAVRRGLDFCPSSSHRILTGRGLEVFVHQWVSVSVVSGLVSPACAGRDGTEGGPGLKLDYLTRSRERRKAVQGS